MGLAASQARLLMLTGRASDLEFKSENIAEKRIRIASEVEKLMDQEQQADQMSSQSSQGVSINDIMSSFGDLIKQFCPEAESTLNVFKSLGSLFGGSFGEQEAQKAASSIKNSIDDEIAKLQEEDKKLQLKLQQVDTQHKAVETELESVQKMIQKNIENSFKLCE
jgi:predicted  nucleic acid-binding Zn-ribbon protein